MQIDICDICEMPIGKTIHQLVIGTITDEMADEKLNLKTLFEYNAYSEKYRDRVKQYELCDNCKKFIGIAIEKRKKELKEFNKEFKELIDQKKEIDTSEGRGDEEEIK